MSTELEKKVDRCLDDLAKLEEHVQHIATTLVKIVEMTPALVREINRTDL